MYQRTPNAGSVVPFVLSLYQSTERTLKTGWQFIFIHWPINVKIQRQLHYNYNHFMALWTMSRTTLVSHYQKVHFAIFWIFRCKLKITQSDAPTIRMDCHPTQTNWCPHLYHPKNSETKWLRNSSMWDMWHKPTFFRYGERVAGLAGWTLASFVLRSDRHLIDTSGLQVTHSVHDGATSVEYCNHNTPQRSLSQTNHHLHDVPD